MVTGAGVISALGPDRAAFWDALAHGRSGIRPIESIDRTQFRFSNGAEVSGYDARQHFDDKQIALTDSFAQFAVVAAREAVKQSGIEFGDPGRTAIVTGSCVGGQGAMDDAFVDIYRKSLPRVNPMMIPRVMANSGASQISMEFGIMGPTYTVSTACSSSNHAIGQAYQPGPFGNGRFRHHRRQRGRLQLRFSEGVGSHARGCTRHVPSVFEGSPWTHSGRGRGDAGDRDA